MVPRGAVMGDIEAGLLAELPIDRSQLQGTIGLIMRSDMVPTPLVGLAIAAIREMSAEIRAEG